MRRCAARELQDLEALLKQQQEERRRRAQRPAPPEAAPEADWALEAPPAVPVALQSAWFAAQQVEFHDISSDGEEVVKGLRYVQRVAELEQQSEELKQRLEQLHAAESALRRESQAGFSMPGTCVAACRRVRRPLLVGSLWS